MCNIKKNLEAFFDFLDTYQVVFSPYIAIPNTVKKNRTKKKEKFKEYLV